MMITRSILSFMDDQYNRSSSAPGLFGQSMKLSIYRFSIHYCVKNRLRVKRIIIVESHFDAPIRLISRSHQVSVVVKDARSARLANQQQRTIITG